jgi:hypothetical protein
MKSGPVSSSHLGERAVWAGAAAVEITSKTIDRAIRRTRFISLYSWVDLKSTGIIAQGLKVNRGGSAFVLSTIIHGAAESIALSQGQRLFAFTLFQSWSQSRRVR